MSQNTKETKDTNETKRCTVTGIITSCYNGPTKFDKADAIRIGLKLDDGMFDKLRKAVDDAGVYNNTSAGFKPKWYTDPKSAEYLNVKTGYDIIARVNNSQQFQVGRDYHLNDDILSEVGSINGSHCALSLVLKEGAIYPLAILIDNLKEVNFEDMFDDLDELPFT